MEASPKPETVWLTGTGQKLEDLLEQYEAEQLKALNSSSEVIIGSNEGGDHSNNNNNYLIRSTNGMNGMSRLMVTNMVMTNYNRRKKYELSEESDGYHTDMRLTIRRLESIDFGSYKCVAKNNLGEKEGLVRLYGKCLWWCVLLLQILVHICKVIIYTNMS